MDQLGAVAGEQYQGGGLSVAATANGALVRCVFQRLEGDATADGLWLRSTADGSSGERFRVMAVKVGRDNAQLAAEVWPATDPYTWTQPALPSAGIVNVADHVARFIRDGLTEEYTVSVDGVRQDFIIEQRPAGDGELRVELDVTGAKAEPLVNGARLVLDGSGRKLAYNRLRVVDSRGHELTAHFQVTDATRLAVVVEDANAVYPVRIDPTFSDADWISLGGIPGANSLVRVTAVDGLGNLYIGGDFTIAGDVVANHIAKWNGSRWTNLGSGLDGSVYALAVSGSDVYAGGSFTTAGGSAASRIAKWNGSSWSALGSGINYYVYALAVSGTDVYAGGFFWTAGGSAASNIAKWNGSSWSALGSGMDYNGHVYALAVSGSDVYAGGAFTTAGGSAASRIAKWNGSSWSTLGSGLDNDVYSLAVSGSDVYAGGR